MKPVNAPAVRPPAATPIESQAPRASRSLAWAIAAASLLIVAALVRFYALELRPLHHDEGVNAYFLMQFVKEGQYRYDPANYHGPVLYYLALAITKLMGLSVFAMRLGPALFGVATVGLAL